jgi:class 3 adenylate cyclase/DNA-binding transcriptional MerR regulator
LLTSKEVMEKTGISRATLNNYIGWGIVPKPQVLPPEPHDGAAPRIGYFPEEVVERITQIQRLKSEGWSMARITDHFAAGRGKPAAAVAGPAAPAATPLQSAAGAMPKLSIEQIEHPAYLVNLEFEVVWSNAAARSGALADFAHLSPSTSSTSVFKYLLQGRSAHDAESRDRLLRFHLGLAKERGLGLPSLCRDAPRDETGALERLYEQADQPEFGLVSHAYLSLAGRVAQPVCLYAVQFREGTLFVYVPGTARSHRDLAIEDLVRKRVPVLTQVAVLVTDLQNSARIWSELPPEEYFELINDIWALVDPIFRRHHGNQGKHGGDGMVCYFFPVAGSSHTWNAVVAAHEMREAMRQVSKAWQARKGWNTELFLNTGLNEGQEWLGTFQSASRTEFTVLGDTINHATRISQFARSGAIWATKNLIGKLTADERARLRYGVRRKNTNGQEVLVAAVFSDVESLADPAAGERLQEIARLPITEIVDIAEPDKRAERASGPIPT